MHAEDAAGDDDEALDPREEARIHRRDHDAEAHHRELLRPGMGKVFKQITDSWGRKAAEPDREGHDGSRRHKR
jgi:hypothetical protein